MKMIVVVALALLAVAAAIPVEPSPPVGIVRSEYVTNEKGGYIFNYETEDGSRREETGELKSVLDEENKPHDVVVVRGSFSYVDKDGKLETITYGADELGYHAEGESIPKSA